MSTSNSVFSCLTCGKLLYDRKRAYLHILQNYGLHLIESLETEFLREECLI